MIRAGFETTDPITQTRSVVVEGAEETDGRGWVIEVHCPEGARPAILEHVHLTWSETFEILEGAATYRLGGEDRAAVQGDVVVMPPGVPHVHPWNTGSGVMVYRQTNDFGAANPSAVSDVLGFFATINGLAREGKIGKKGLPKNPLQFAATLRTLVKHEGFDAAVPIPIQRGTSATLGRLAEALGYRGVYQRYLT
ncbi:MAG: cupin domain-containing protein [Gemmatimonadota bacterium]